MEKLKAIFGNPILNFSLALIGIALAVYFYLQSVKKPELTFYVSPTRTAILKTEGNNSLTNLSVSLDGKQIVGDLSAAEIQIWNNGRAAIHHENILEPIQLKTLNHSTIYQVLLSTNQSHDYFYRMTNQVDTGTIQLDWKILEHSDGAKLQVIYGGSVTDTFEMDGAIEEQQTGIQEFTVRQDTQTIKHPLLLKWTLCVISFCTIILLISVNALAVKASANERHKKRLNISLMLNCISFIVILFIVLRTSIHFTIPPFGF